MNKNLFLTRSIRTAFTIAVVSLLGISTSSAAFYNTGWSYVSDWDNLTGSNFGSIAQGPSWHSSLAPTSGWQAVTPTNDQTYIDAAKPVNITRTSGGHYSATLGLYAFTGADHSTFDFNVTTGTEGWETVVFQERKGPNPEISSPAPLLNIIGGAQGLAALTTVELFRGNVWVDAIGQYADITDTLYQWDLRGHDLSNGFVIDHTVAIHESLQAFQIAGSTIYQAVPEPGTYAAILGGAGLVFLLIRRRKALKAA